MKVAKSSVPSGIRTHVLALKVPQGRIPHQPNRGTSPPLLGHFRPMFTAVNTMGLSGSLVFGQGQRKARQGGKVHLICT